MPQSPRHLALTTLSRWTTLTDPPQLPERGAPLWAPLTTRDRNFAFDLINGVIRHRGTLDAMLAANLRQPLDTLEPKVHAALWLGAFQLLFQDTRAYAAVDATVDLAREAGIGRASGLINAVLRGITRMNATVEVRHGLSRRTFPRDFTHQVVVNRDVFPDPTASHLPHLAAVTSAPVPLVRMLIQAHGEALATNVLIRNNLRPAVILRTDDPAFTPPPEAGLTPHDVPRFYVAAAGWNAAVESLVSRGVLSPQDPTSAKAANVLVDALQTRAGGSLRVLDLCAGMGTKTIQLARALPAAQVTATDIDDRKLDALRARAAALRLENIATAALGKVTADPAEARFDAVLIDAPCSNTGVMARRVQSRWRWPVLDLATLRKTQADLLRHAAGLLAPGGVIVYATCSIDPAENQQVVHAFLNGRAGDPPLAARHEEVTLPAFTQTTTEMHDGGYLALLVSG